LRADYWYQSYQTIKGQGRGLKRRLVSLINEYHTGMC
jgi:hypothetical protein